MLTLIPLTDDHLLHVLEHITPEDAAEVQASGIDPLESFMFGAKHSTILGTVVKDGTEPVAIFGCLPDPNHLHTGVPWMVATPEFRRHPRDGMALSRQVVDQMQAAFPKLHNLVHDQHITAIRWLSWLGFTIDIEHPTGPCGAFYHFHWSKEDV